MVHRFLKIPSLGYSNTKLGTAVKRFYRRRVPSQVTLRLIEIIQVGLTQWNEPFKSRIFSSYWNSERFKEQEGFSIFAGLKMQGACNEECRRPLKAESSCWLAASKETMISIPQTQDEFSKEPVNLQKDSKPSPWFQPGKTLSRESRHHNPDLWPVELWDNKGVLLEAPQECGDVLCSERKQIQTGFQVWRWWWWDYFRWFPKVPLSFARSECWLWSNITEVAWVEETHAHPWMNHNMVRKGMFCSRYSARQETWSPGSYFLLCVTLGKLLYISSLFFFQLQDAAIHPFPIYRATHEIQVMGPTTICIVANSGET